MFVSLYRSTSLLILMMKLQMGSAQGKNTRVPLRRRGKDQKELFLLRYELGTKLKVMSCM